MSWPLAQFKDVAQVVTGSTPKKIDENYNGTIPFVTPGDLGEHSVVSSAKVTVTELGAESGRLLPKGTVMVCCIGATIGKVGISDRKVISNQQINSLVFDESKVFPQYAYYFCATIKPLLVARSSSTTMPIVNKSNFSEFTIPLPPIEEQKRIAAILDKADAIRHKRQQAIQLADDFLRSVFLDMFGDPKINPFNWTIKPLSDLIAIGDRLNYGVVQPGIDAEKGVPLVRSGDLYDVTPDLKRLRTVSSEIDEKHWKSRLRGNEILIACVGSIGKVGWVTKEMIGWNIARAVTRIPLRDDVNREYIYRYLQSPVVQAYFQQETRAVAQPTLNVGLIGKTPIALPPIELQRKFLAKFESIAVLKKKMNFELSIESNLFNSLSQRAFAGEL